MSAASSPTDRCSLPLPRTPLVGRAAKVASARAFVLDEAVPLLTLTGPGGVGKTRLALAIAHEVAGAFADGAGFVDLSPLRDPALVLPAIAQALGIRAAGDRPLADHVAAILKPKQLLLLLDNCEQVLDAAPAIAALLAGCPAVQILATSRAPLRVRGEQLLPVPPLALPDPAAPSPLGELAATEAVALFAQRARSADPGFTLTDGNAAAVAGVCARLDGLPLAIELAAARLRSLSVEALRALLTERLRVLTGGERDRPGRHQTLRDTIAWSHDLLTPDAQVLFRRLAVFAGGFDGEAATAVGGGDALGVLDGVTGLADQSLLVRSDETGGTPRWALLETVREFALAALVASGEEPAVRRAHAAHFLAVAEAAEPHLLMPGHEPWLARLATEHDNLRAALAWLEQSGDGAAMLRLAGALDRFWFVRSFFGEGRGWQERALALAGDTAPAALRAKALGGAGRLAVDHGDPVRAEVRITQSLALWRELGDAEHVALNLIRLGLALDGQERYAEATVATAEAFALYEGMGDDAVTAASMASIALANLGAFALWQGEYARAKEYLEQALARCRALGYTWQIGNTLTVLGRLALTRDDVVGAAAHYGEGLEHARLHGDLWMAARAINGMAAVALALGRPERAVRLFGAEEALDAGSGHSMSAGERARNEQMLATARAALGAGAFAAAYAAGRGLPLDQAIAEALTAAEPDRSTPSPIAAPVPLLPAAAYGLSPRELEVLALVAQHLTDKEIAERLFLSPRTVMAHVARLLGKLDVPNRRQAAALAAREGLL